ncbi:MAG: DUF4440 domain-containing protein [Ponticaulis sp.]|nr:DUF4440 domain-containing protein [Ponticaulis sp.]|tara:strand:- start:12742 stop:13254 length:513 start_codon:yes stop_codon:yes gene_type:complete
MKMISIPAVLVAITLAACQPTAIAITEEDRLAIEASSRHWVETYNRNDWDTLSNLFTPDAILMPPNGPAVIGRSAIAEWEQTNEAGFRIAFDLQSIDGAGDTAYVRGRSCVFIPDGAGKYGVDVGKFLEVRKRQSDGTWLIKADIFNSDLSVGGDLLAACPFDSSQIQYD